MNKKKEPFAKRHPKLNLLFSFLVLAVLIGVAFIILCLLFEGIRIFIDWLASITSKLDAVIVVALITGIISVLSVIVSKLIEYKKSRDDYLAKKRESPYGSFVDMVYKITDNSKNPGNYSSEAMKNDILTFSKEITLWGSSRVLRRWNEFRENGNDPTKAVKNLYVIEELMNEMRRDLGMKKVRKGGLLSVFINDMKTATRK